MYPLTRLALCFCCADFPPLQRNNRCVFSIRLFVLASPNRTTPGRGAGAPACGTQQGESTF